MRIESGGFLAAAEDEFDDWRAKVAVHSLLAVCARVYISIRTHSRKVVRSGTSGSMSSRPVGSSSAAAVSVTVSTPSASPISSSPAGSPSLMMTSGSAIGTCHEGG